MSRLQIRIIGNVQGVFFRSSAREIALSLSIRGWVKNEEDGSVLTLVEGPKNQLEKYMAWCEHGPSRAIVKEIKYKWLEFENSFQDFQIRPF